jgi:hypothetical protein
MATPWLVTFSVTGIGAGGGAAEVLTDGATVTWDLGYIPSVTATLTIGGNRTLAFSNVPTNYAVGTLVVTQDGAGGHTLALPAGHKVVNSGDGVVTLTAAAGSVDVLMFQKVGATYYWTVGADYTAA